MSSPYVGEIRMFGGSFAPVGWALCQGQAMPISQNETLFQLIGTTYGGDGQNTFDLPDLQGRVPIHQGQGSGISQQYIIGEEGGVEQVTLTTQQMPQHNHAWVCNTGAQNNPSPANAIFATAESATIFFSGQPDVSLNTSSVAPQGGSQPHENMQPFLVVSFILSLYGIYPSPT